LARKILLADDSVTAQNMGRRILSDAGYDVTTVNNGSAALKKIAESKPDLIVLDVYMPGYGGLEVCQRLREAPETARIPVLLTVGKLEPFKADEARRVRADGFIVKPFEASELLTALTKLEDKIVPQSQPAKPSRFAKALAEADESASGKEFGDRQTGWKNRLPIPPPHSKPRESAPEESPAAVASSCDAAKAEERKPAEMKSGLEEAMLSSMPQDVTAEEIAAIKAASSSFNAPSEESSFRPRPARDQEAPTQERVAHGPDVKVPDVKAEELPSEFVVSAENISAVTEAESSATPGETTSVEPVSSRDVPAETVPPPAVMVSESPASTAPQGATAETGQLADEEVTAALASLAPANANVDATAIDAEAAKSDLAARDRVPVTMAFAGATQEFNGARWIAEPVAVMENEATLVLQHEMEQAYAAFAAADAARMSSASSPAEPYASLGGAEATSETASSTVESFSNSDSSESKPQESISPTVATSSEESAAAEAELSAAKAFPTVDAVSESAASEVKESAAYAAAASASPSIGEATMAAEAGSQPRPQVESPESVPPEPSGRQGESDLAAAWANWREIRESVIGSQLIGSQLSGSQLSGSQLSSQIADAVAELKQSSSEAQPESRPDGSSATGEEAREIANIVDSVLADLKPKLMAEIALKMGKEKKK